MTEKLIPRGARVVSVETPLEHCPLVGGLKGTVQGHWPTPRCPYLVLFDRDGKRVWRDCEAHEVRVDE